MCEICKTSVARNYTHAKNKHHIKNLYEIMKIKQINNYYIQQFDFSSVPLFNLLNC